jgi:ATPase subunit of ABC transporter with duplicated ATPase domains
LGKLCRRSGIDDYDGRKQVNSRAYLSRFNLAEEQNKKVSMLSGGERNRLPSNDLKEEGNVLLLDEPTMDINTLRALEKVWKVLQVAVVISHDRWF